MKVSKDKETVVVNKEKLEAILDSLEASLVLFEQYLCEQIVEDVNTGKDYDYASNTLFQLCEWKHGIEPLVAIKDQLNMKKTSVLKHREELLKKNNKIDFKTDEKDKLIKELSDDVVELTTQDETFTNCFGEKMKRTKQ